MINAGDGSPGALQGIRVIDFTQWVAGPTATRLLADMGAEVIKVELPPIGDQSRRTNIAPGTLAQGPMGGYFILHNRGKKGLCVNFRQPEGQAIIKDLTRVSDVVIENFTAGTLARHNLSYQELSAVNPKIIMCSISGYGQDSPYAKRVANDAVGLAVGGFINMIGEPDKAPAYPTSAIGDHIGGLNAYGAILTALFHRERTGAGQYIDIALADCVFNVHDWALAAYDLSRGQVDATRGGMHRMGAFPYGSFRVGDGYIILGIFRDDQWVTLMKGMGKEEFAQPEFADLQWRLQNQDALQIIIEEWLQEQFATPEEAVSFLADQLGLAAAPVLTVGQFTRNPHLARRIVGRVQDPFLGELLALESPQKLSETPPRIYRRAPYLGEHNESILRDILQYPAEHIQHLREAGVLVEEPELAKVRQREGNAS